MDVTMVVGDNIRRFNDLGYIRVLWLVCWFRKMEIWVHSLLTEDISKTEDSLYISAGGVFVQ